ncbi:MAG: hypothetical protein ACFE9N_10685 [Promethearchaeota archaeon]
MDLKTPNFIGKIHCPNCGSLYLIIDNEIISCPVCEVSINSKKQGICEECARREGISSVTNLNFNKSSYY